MDLFTLDGCCINAYSFIHLFNTHSVKTFGTRGILISGVRPWRDESVWARKKPWEHHISKNNEGNFTELWPQMYLRTN